VKPRYEVADVFSRHSHHLPQLTQNAWQCRTLQAIADCRTPAMGGHIDRCSNSKCAKLHISYNSCRNRHCPKCQGNKREEWMLARENELLKVPYYHVVFTLPNELGALCLNNKSTMYSLLFKVAWQVIKGFADNPKFIGAKTGMIAILHTWGQNLSFHPHLHCIVPGGGISDGGKWKNARSHDKFLFPVKAMSKVFRAKFIEELRHVDGMVISQATGKQLFAKNWVVYCKRPFFGPQQVVEYLGRYTHKIAISNHRIRDIKDGQVNFSAKDYRHGGKKILVSLSEEEFIRRFALHVLPKGFVRIRHYGFLSSSLKKKAIPTLQDELGKVVLKERATIVHRSCPICKIGQLETLLTFSSRGPPKDWQYTARRIAATA
jgi:hypothetical protein